MTQFLSFLFKHQHAVVMSNSKEKKKKWHEISQANAYGEGTELDRC